MKKLLFAVLVTIAVATSSFAAGTNVSVSVLHSFKSKFENATNVSWLISDQYAKATFVVDNSKMEVFYTEHGDLIATSKSINMEELPVDAKRAFAKKFAGYAVKEVIRFEDAAETALFFSAENEKESIIFKIGNNEKLTTYKKTKK